MRLIRNHGEAIVEDMGIQDLANIIGFNYRMTELEAAVSIGQFRQLDYLNDCRIELAEYLTKKLSRFPGLVLPGAMGRGKHVYFAYAVKFKEDVVGVSCKTFVRALEAEGIPFGTGYVKPLYLAPIYQKMVAYGKKGCPFTCAYYQGSPVYSKGGCPVCEKMYEKELMLTGICRHPHTKKDIDDAIAAFGKIFDNLEELKKIK